MEEIVPSESENDVLNKATSNVAPILGSGSEPENPPADSSQP